MFEWIWGCMVLSFKATVGTIFWMIGFWGFVFLIAGIVMLIQALMEK